MKKVRKIYYGQEKFLENNKIEAICIGENSFIIHVNYDLINGCSIHLSKNTLKLFVENLLEIINDSENGEFLDSLIE